ncbi:MAG: UrcA family protein [Pseudomonadota bacterium]
MKLLMIFAASAAIAAPAAAQSVRPSASDPEMLESVVRLGDLDLRRPEGAAVAVQRLRRASRAVCGGNASVAPIEISARRQTCMEGALARAVQDLDAPLVTRAYGRTAGQQLAAR